MSGSDLFTGTLDILILKTLRGRARHGYAIGRWIRDHRQGVLSLEEGALYSALHRLKGKGLLGAEWGKTATGPRLGHPGSRGQKIERRRDITSLAEERTPQRHPPADAFLTHP